MRYCVDTSSFMEAEVRFYPRAVFPTLWERIEALVDSGELGSAEEVMVEIGVVDDELFAWCQARPQMFHPTDAAIQADVARLQVDHPGFVPTTGASRADPFVVATAIATGSAVVTQEKKSTGGPPKIPDVCAAEGIACIDLLALIRAEGWTF